MRGKLNVAKDLPAQELEKMACELDNVKAHLSDKQIVKIITIPNKIVNIVVK